MAINGAETGQNLSIMAGLGAESEFMPMKYIMSVVFMGRIFQNDGHKNIPPIK